MSDNTNIDPKHFRSVLGHFPTGVTIVTGMSATGPVGLTIGSFTSVSLDPPLVGFLPQTSSGTWAAMAEHGSFCVNVLGADQADLCWRFAKSGNEESRYEGVSWHPGATGSPVIDGSIAWIDCRVESVHEMGDHYFVLGRVVDLAATDEPSAPMLFFRGGLGSFSSPGTS